MSKLARGLRIAVLAAGVAGLAACAQTSSEEMAQARSDAASAQAAADRASQAADSASAAQMAAERSDRAMAQGLRK